MIRAIFSHPSERSAYMLDLAAESYPNIEAFYIRNPEARRSPESDYGVWWKGPDGDNWRVTFVHETGHVYAIRLGGTVSGRLDLGGGDSADVFVSAGDGSGEGPVLILGQVASFTAEDEARVRREHWAGVAPPPIEEWIDGWAEKCGEQGSLEWIALRIRAAVAAGA